MDEIKITRWMVDSDTWSKPKPSEVFPAPVTNETKVVQWRTDKDLWDPVVERTRIRPTVTPTHLYAKQHVQCLIEYTADLDGVPQDIQVVLNGSEFRCLSIARNVLIPIASFKEGINAIELVSSDGAIVYCSVVLDTEYRTRVERTFNSIDGGYILSNVILNGKAEVKV